MPSKPFHIDGLAELRGKLQGLTDTLKEDIAQEVKASAQAIVASAKRNAPKNNGFLVQGISEKEISQLEREVVSSSPVSAFLEFGTRSKVQIPAGYEEFANEFKGQGTGSALGFYEAILQWVKEKGIVTSANKGRYQSKAYAQDQEERNAAYLIMRSIYLHGSKPHPFFIPAIEAEKPKFIERVKKIVTDIK